MASKNLGAVIQRAISDGAFRRQLQSDPAAALRGFNLTPNEIAAIRSGDASKLMSLGVDQRVSKAFTVGGGFLGATRSATSDMGTGATSNGIIGDPTSGTHDALTSGSLSGTRAVNDVAPVEGNVNAAIDPTVSGTRAIHDDAPADLRSAASTGDLSGTRSVNDSEPFDSRSAASAGDADATRAVHDDAPADLRSAASTGSFDGTRAINDSAPFDGSGRGGSLAGDMNDNLAAANAGRGGSLAGDMSGTGADAVRSVNDVAPFEGNVNTAAAGDLSGPDGNSIAADDNFSVASRMADAGDASSVRSVNDVAPFDSGIANTAAPTSEFIGGDIQHDPGLDATHGFVPSDSADVQREMLDGTTDGGALGNTGSGHPS